MAEQHNIEYKESWHDRNLKEICAFANTTGGTLFIGIDDKGGAVGVINSKSLLEKLPNKMRDILGICPELELLNQNGKDIIKITIQPSISAINYEGRYYLRIGSISQELSGNALTDFLLRKTGQTWDNILELSATLDDIDEEAVELFIKASEELGRPINNKGLSLKQLLDKLRLIENGKLKRAALILFGKDPRKFYPNAFLQIAKIGEDESQLLFQDRIEYCLIKQLSSFFDLLNSGYVTKRIRIEGAQRRELPEYPEIAIREILLNALAHRDYMGAQTQIKVYDNKINFWNEGLLPANLTIEDLSSEHKSIPRNPIIADILYKAGYIESWGSGFARILKASKDFGLPELDIEEVSNGLSITLYKEDIVNENYLKEKGLNQRQIDLILMLKLSESEVTNSEYRQQFGISERTASRELGELTELKLLEKFGDRKSTYYKYRNIRY